MIEASHEQEMTEATQNTLFPAIKHIDTSVFDNATLHVMMTKAAQAVELGRSPNSKDALCKELIKRWKPNKKPDFN